MQTNALGVSSHGPQHLLLSLLGDYWYEQAEVLPSTALVRVLAEFGVTEGNARAALSRLARRGLLRASRRGRHTGYALTEQGHGVLRDGTKNIFSFDGTPPPWDGTWTMVSFSVPEGNRATRGLLRRELRRDGFASLYDALWVAPGNRRGEATATLLDLGVGNATVIVGEASAPDGRPPVADWGLAELEERYKGFMAHFAPLARRLGAVASNETESLKVRTAVLDMWRAFPEVDPRLPAELLPKPWPAVKARGVFTGIYDTLGPPAARRFRALVAIDDEVVAHDVCHHASDVLENFP